MDFDKIIADRRSIRKFSAKQVTDEQISAIIDSARKAPSGMNIQSTRFVVLKTEEGKGMIAGYTLPFVTKAPVVLVCCTDKSSVSKISERNAELDKAGVFSEFKIDQSQIDAVHDRLAADQASLTAFLFENAGISVEHAVLKAVDLGLGSCWVGMMDRVKIKEALQLEDRYEVVALLPLGYPDKLPPERPRLPLEDFVIKTI